MLLGSSTEKLHQKLGLEFLHIRWWFRKLCIFYKTVKKQSPKYLFDLIPSSNNSYCQHTRYLQSDWSRRVQYWLYFTLSFNIVLFDQTKKQTNKEHHSISMVGKYFFIAIRVFQTKLNTDILNSSIDYILSTRMFEYLLFRKAWFVT